MISKRFGQWWRVDPWLLGALLVFAGLLFIFGEIADEVSDGEALAFDRSIILAFRDAANPANPIGPAWLQEMGRDVTALGSFVVLGIMVFAAAAYLFLAGKHKTALFLLAAVIGGVVLNSLLKMGFARPRPELVAPAARVFTASFPSGHAAASAIAYLTLGALLARATPSRLMRIYFLSVALLLTGIVGVSRVYLGVHYPTDVLAGWCIGSAWALGCWTVMIWLQQRGRVEAPQERNEG